jgi:hypothetical protein
MLLSLLQNATSITLFQNSDYYFRYCCIDFYFLIRVIQTQVTGFEAGQVG